MSHHNIDLLSINSLALIIDRFCPPKRKPIYSTVYFLHILIDIIKDGSSFRRVCKNSLKPHHYSTVWKKFNLWSSMGLFDIVYNKLISIYNIEFVKQHKNILELYIDSTDIRNKNGKAFIGPSFKDKGKNGNKITTIVDKNNFPLYIKIDRANTNDGKIVKKIIPKLVRNINLVADKGYIINNKDKIEGLKRNIKLIHPYRKNQKKFNSEQEKDSLKNRYRVENTFATFKQYKKIQHRYEKGICNYKSFVILTAILIGYRIMDKKRKNKENLTDIMDRIGEKENYRY